MCPYVVPERNWKAWKKFTDAFEDWIYKDILRQVIIWTYLSIGKISFYCCYNKVWRGLTSRNMVTILDNFC